MPYSLTFQEPQWLVLLALVPGVWWFARRSLAALGGWRALVAKLLRAGVLSGVIVALAGPQLNRANDKVAVAYLLDQSASIPAADREAMLHYVTASVERHRRAAHDDRAAVVVFGREATVEVPPVPFTPDLRRLETQVDASATNLAEALTTGAAVLPSDAARRVVLLSDGNENLGTASRESRRLWQSGVGIDVVPATTSGNQDVAVEQVAVPSAVKKDQPLEVRVVLNNQGTAPMPVAGRLRVVRRSGSIEETLAEEAVTLPPGKTVKSFRETLRASDFYVYEARFLPDEPGQDRFAANNVATGFTDVRGQGRVLLIEDALQPGEFAHLVDALRNEGLEVDVAASDRAFATLAELQRYDGVILANLPRVASDDAGTLTSLSDDQIDMLVRNTRELGCGLVMLGGERSFGAGGWVGTELEKAMPVDFQVKNAQVIPSGALALVIDRSGSMAGEKLALSLAAAREAIKMLGPRDFVSVVAFDTEALPVVPLQRKGTGRSALARVSRIGEGGGTDLYPAMVLAHKALQRADASVKHMIVLTDGQTPEAEFDKLCRQMEGERITITAVAVGPDAERTLLARIAKEGGGKFYAVANPRNVPRIFVAEARRIATPVIRNLDPAESPIQVGESQLVAGIADGFPPLGGFVQTSVKDSPLVEVLLRSPVPTLEKNATVLATWTYGLGKAAVFTSDAGHRWASAWLGWQDYGKFFSQLVRWSLRPSGGQENYTIATQTTDARTHVVIDAFDPADEFVNQLPLRGTAVGPDLQPVPLQVEQTAAGRYTGEFPSQTPGSYFVTVATPQGSLLRAGVNVGVSREYSDFQSNLPLLETLAQGAPRGGEPGNLSATAELDPFRRDLPPAITSRDVWPLLLVAVSLVFLSDIFVRRVQLDLTGIGRRAARLFHRSQPVEASATLERLSARKAEVRGKYQTTIDSQRSLDELQATPSRSRLRVPSLEPPPVDVPEAKADDAMARLLELKRRRNR